MPACCAPGTNAQHRSGGSCRWITAVGGNGEHGQAWDQPSRAFRSRVTSEIPALAYRSPARLASLRAVVAKKLGEHGTNAALQHLGWTRRFGRVSSVSVMLGLRETTAFLKRQRTSLSATPRSRRKGRMAETPRFGDNPGSLQMFSYIPDTLALGAPLVVVLHGCTQRAEAYADAAGWLSLADRCGFAVIAPEQIPANNPNRCFNWFEPGDASRGQGEAASIRNMVAAAVEQHGLDPSRVFVTGLSAGGAMTAVMLATYPEVFAGGAIIAGLPFGVAENLQEALSAMYAERSRSSAALGELVRRAAPTPPKLPRISIWHGDSDTTVRPHNAKDLAMQWSAAHGLPHTPSETQRLAGRTHMLWRAPSTGEILIESILIDGMGHGTPVCTSGPEGVGSAGAYLLEAGVSSSVEIARFWGIPVPVAQADAPTTEPSPSRQEDRRRRREHPRRGDQRGSTEHGNLADQVMNSVSPYIGKDVQGVIAKALKTAGLMK